MVYNIRPPFITICSDDTKTYMILNRLDELFTFHIGCDIFGASGSELRHDKNY